MPTYEYRCRRCGHRFSEFQRMVDPPVKKCPKCASKNSVERLISGGAGLIFKGSGFYITDYKNKGTGAEKDKGSKPEKSGEKKGDD